MIPETHVTETVQWERAEGAPESSGVRGAPISSYSDRNQELVRTTVASGTSL